MIKEIRMGALALALVFCFAVQASAAANTDYGDIVEIIPLEINAFSFGRINGEYLENVRFTVSGGDGEYEYALAAGVLAADGSMEGSREVYRSSAALGQEVVLNCDLRDRLDSYDNYALILNVWKYYGQLELNESAIAKGTFSYVNPNTPGAIEDFRVIVDITDHTVYINYADWAVLSAQSYLIMVDDGSPEVYFAALDNDKSGAAVLFEEDASSLIIEVSYKDSNGRQSGILKKTVEIVDFVTFEVDEVTANAQAKISYATPRDIVVKVYVSKGNVFYSGVVDEDFQEIKLSGSGFFSVNLFEFDNLISVEYDSGDNVTVIKQASVHRSSIGAPVLILPEHAGAISTGMDTFDIAGLTEPGTAIAVNGLPVSTENDGSFIHKVELLDGENIFEITASVGAGNVTSQSVVIIKTTASSGNGADDASVDSDNVFLLGSFIAALLFVLFMFIFRKRFAKTWGKNKLQAVINICRNISAPFFVIAAAFFGYTGLRYSTSNRNVNSRPFAESGLLDPVAMYDGIQKNQMNRDEFLKSAKMLIVVGVIFGVLLAASVLYYFISKAVKRPKDTAG